ncbi:MAG: lysylphosphatidylglycerol synthase domain-containing protein [Planctomycetota bacterium]
MNNAKRLRHFFPYFIYAATIVFFAIYLSGLDYGRFYDLRVAPLPLIASLVIAICFRYWGVIVWRRILIDLGSREVPRFSLLSNVYAKAWMARYIPGSVAWLAGKVLLASDLGISKSRLTVASLNEAAVQVVALLATSAVLLTDERVTGVMDATTLAVVIAIVTLGGVVLFPPVFNFLVSRVFRLITNQAASPELATNYRTLLCSFGLYFAGAFISGTAYFLLCRSIFPIAGWTDWLFVLGATNLAGALGMATPLVPSGAGVRDVSMLFLLSAVLPNEVALVVTVCSRVWSALADVSFFLLTSLHHQLRK